MSPQAKRRARRCGIVRRGALGAASAAVFLLATAEASAHDVGLSRGTYSIDGRAVRAELVFSRREIVALVPALDADDDGRLSPEEIDSARAPLQKMVVARIRAVAGESDCPGKLVSAASTDQDGVEIRAAYECPSPIQRASLTLDVLEDLAPGHRHIARVVGGVQVVETVLSRANRTLQMEAAPGSHTDQPEKRAPFSLLRLGIEHILTGYDHLTFLLGLVLVGGRWRSILWVVTAFTVAHSITLGLAALGVWAPRPSIIEPMIAVSIAYVGVENFFVKNAENRWRITFPFGLIHGFGFAGALQEVALPRADVPAALFLFNLGVEIGQLGVLALALPLLAVVRRKPWFEKKGIRILSGLIVIAGVVMFIARVAIPP
ncbi:MAG: HupE/UreJ family protein [Polyangiaceae bacterium]